MYRAADIAIVKDTFIVPPTAAHTHSAILLHGRGSTAADFATEFFESQASVAVCTCKTARSHLSTCCTLPEIFPGIKWVFPTAKMIQSARFNEDMSQWFDMYTTESPHERHSQQDQNDQQLDEAAATVNKMVAVEAAIIGHDKTFLGGISQGSATALHALKHVAVPLAGFIGLCTWHAEHASNPEFAQGALRTPVYLSHSLDDETISEVYGRDLRDVLTSLGMHVDWDEHEDGGHWINEPRSVDSIVAFIKQCM